MVFALTTEVSRFDVFQNGEIYKQLIGLTYFFRPLGLAIECFFDDVALHITYCQTISSTCQRRCFGRAVTEWQSTRTWRHRGYCLAKQPVRTGARSSIRGICTTDPTSFDCMPGNDRYQRKSARTTISLVINQGINKPWLQADRLINNTRKSFAIPCIR